MLCLGKLILISIATFNSARQHKYIMLVNTLYEPLRFISGEIAGQGKFHQLSVPVMSQLDDNESIQCFKIT